MEVTSVSSANQVRAPPPMECRPGSGTNFYAGYWDTSTGTEIKNTPYSNTAGRIDIEGVAYLTVTFWNKFKTHFLFYRYWLVIYCRVLLLGSWRFANSWKL